VDRESHSITLNRGGANATSSPLFSLGSPRPSKTDAASNQLGANSAKEKILPSAMDLNRFVGRYEFFSSSEPSFKEAVVEIVGGQLTISITGNTQTLMPITTGSGRLAHEINVVSFRLVGQPDAHVRFFMAGETLRGLYYEEKRENEDLVVAIAAPKF
jgi:hypothetical protein